VVIGVAEHSLFRRRGTDLFYDLPITLPQAALGADLAIPLLDGETTIRLAPGTPSGKQLRLAERGVPPIGGGRRGDLHLRVLVEVPQDLTPAQCADLERLARSFEEGQHPQRAELERIRKERLGPTRT
jgi:molecular chaperone DnaJ